MKIFLAPMEGVADFLIRDTLTQIGGLDASVTEFIRVTNTVLGKKSFIHRCPELENQCKTQAGTLVTPQLLGSDPEMMAANAMVAVELGAQSIDLNFGCPAKIVNRNLGGSVLLKSPETIFNIVNCVRKTLPEHIPLSAKIRLGYEDKSLAIDNALAVESAGAQLLVIHARTKREGYQPPAHWDWIGKIKTHVNIPIVANGEIWSLQDYQRCQQLSGCDDVMLGRGILVRPDLAREIKDPTVPRLQPLDIIKLLIAFQQQCDRLFESKYAGNRLKQWLSYLKNHYDFADKLFELVKRERQPEKIMQTLLAAQAYLCSIRG